MDTSAGFIYPLTRSLIQVMEDSLTPEFPSRWRHWRACDLGRKPTMYLTAGSISPVFPRSRCTRRVLYFMKVARHLRSSLFPALNSP